MPSIVCRPGPEDAENLSAILSNIAKFYPHLVVQAGEGYLTLEHECSLEAEMRRAFLAACLTARFGAVSADFRKGIWELLLR
jgi:hypothetical protein